MNRHLPSAAVLLVVLLVLAACAAPGGSPQPSGSESPPASDDGGGGGGTDDDAIEHPTGADEAILVVDSIGGFVPVDFMVTQMPAFVLYGDGRVVMMGMQTLEFPGPALPALIERRLSEEGIQAILEAVVGTGQFDTSRELRGAMAIVADAPDTRFQINAAGREVLVSIYGLGTLLPDMELPQPLPPGEAEAHEALMALNDQLLMLDNWLPADAWASDGWVPYEPAAFRLYVRDVTGEPIDGGVQEHVMDWPTDDDPATFGEEQPFFGNGTRCGVADAEAGEAWLEALSEATQSTRWTDGGERRFTVVPRPLLPHEEAACPEIVGAA